MPTWKVKINVDIELKIEAEKSADAESAALSRLIDEVLNQGIVDIMDPRSIHAEEISEDDSEYNRHGVVQSI